MEFVWCVKMVTMAMNVSMNVHSIVILVHVTSKMEGATVLLDTLVILVENVHQTVTTLDVMMIFIVTHAALDSMVTSVTRPALDIVYTTGAKEMVNVHVM